MDKDFYRDYFLDLTDSYDGIEIESKIFDYRSRAVRERYEQMLYLEIKTPEYIFQNLDLSNDGLLYFTTDIRPFDFMSLTSKCVQKLISNMNGQLDLIDMSYGYNNAEDDAIFKDCYTINIHISISKVDEVLRFNQFKD